MLRWLLLLSCFLLGCGAADDSRVAGVWRGAPVPDGKKEHPGAELNLDRDHHFRELFGNMEVEGTWLLSGAKVTLTTAKVNGLDVAEARKRMLENASKATYPEVVRKMADKLGEPVSLDVSPDGRSLSAEGQTVAGETIYSRN